jgi:uncharacterized protein (DUF924 family)
MDILTYWFPNNDYNSWWFNSSHDNDIYNKYYNIMLEKFKTFNINNYNINNPEEIITDIIILDQFSRNINRITNNINILDYTIKANQLSQLWIKYKIYLEVPIRWTVFAFLPIRHLKDINENKKLLIYLNEIIEKDNNIVNNKIYQKFKYHTEQHIKKLCPI